MDELKNKIAKVLGSRRFYWVVVGFFVFEALWIAFSAKYPMAFDEDFHFGVIKIYSEHWLPFLAGQPENANQFGALATDPSYLYHYLMSFPYRFISVLTSSEAAQVIFLRLINIAIITYGVVLFRKVLLRAGSSQALVNTATLLFALVPTVPLLAGQINYDSLLLLALAWVCWLVLGVTEDSKARKIDLKAISLLAVSLMFACLVKYAFLPLALAAFVYVAVIFWLAFRGRGKALKKAAKKSYVGLGQGLKIGLLTMLVVGGGFFAQRYVSNVVSYGNPVPDCAAVIGIEACMEYGPWGRNYRYAADKAEHNTSPLAYTWTWVQGLHYRLFFMITGPPKHTNHPPVPLPSAAALVILLFAVTGLLFYWRETFNGRPFLVFLLAMTLVYAGTLWSQNYSQFLETGRPVAINGRYFIPLLLPLAAVLGRALAVSLKPWKDAKTWAAAVAIILFLQGGGVFSFILRSDEAWFWPNKTVVHINEGASAVLDPFIIEGPTSY